MIRFLNVYYPTRTVVLLICEAFIVSGCFFAATWIELGDQAVYALQLENGYLKIAAITIVSLILSYYFDLYEPSVVSGRLEIYFRILLVLGFDCFLLSIFLKFDPDVAIGDVAIGSGSYVYVVGFALLAPCLILWRRAYEWVIARRIFRERVYVLGAGDYARSIVDTIRSRPDMGMEVVNWEDVEMEASERKEFWIAALDKLSRTRWSGGVANCRCRNCCRCASRESSWRKMARCGSASTARSNSMDCGPRTFSTARGSASAPRSSSFAR
jgi:hypothetical protein